MALHQLKTILPVFNYGDVNYVPRRKVKLETEALYALVLFGISALNVPTEKLDITYADVSKVIGLPDHTFVYVVEEGWEHQLFIAYCEDSIHMQWVEEPGNMIHGEVWISYTLQDK